MKQRVREKKQHHWIYPRRLGNLITTGSKNKGYNTAPKNHLEKEKQKGQEEEIGYLADGY